jgi:hypothetical protein
VVLQVIIMVQMKASVSMWFRKNNHGINRDAMVYLVLQINHAGTNRDSSFYVVLQRIILVQLEAPVLRLFYKESCWYK